MLPTALASAFSNNQLVIVAGTGTSMALTNDRNPRLSWRGLIRDGFAYAGEKGRINAKQIENWASQIESSDPDDLITAAEFVGRKLGAPTGDLYARWLERAFGAVRPENPKLSELFGAIANLNIPIATLNYDSLLEVATGQNSIVLAETTRVAAWMRRQERGVLHLNGLWSRPDTCILGVRDYHEAVSDGVRGLVERSLSSFSHLLFIGCGDTFADPNFSALIAWLRRSMGAAAPLHYALVRNEDVVARLAEPAWQGFVEPIGYGSKFSDLATFLDSAVRQLPNASPKQIVERQDAGNHERVIEAYIQAVLRDSGEMTLEGMQADMDTAQRKFALERLFVPLEVTAVPPEIPASDPERERKMRKWLADNRRPRPFGEVFFSQKRLALLALPGGGKTVLLKRLAVAYADPTRLNSSPDGLPAIDLLPIPIRCREWRDFITRPISFILENYADLTGQPSLRGLYEALIPRLTDGSALLLIDGLDEIHNDSDRSTFVENVEKFLSDFPKIRLVVTSREAGFALVAPSLARFCSRWRVSPLNDEAIRMLCLHWRDLMGADAATPDDAEYLASQIIQNPSLLRLAENPLLCTMLLVVKHGAGRLPPDRASLYDRAVDVLLDTWNIKGHEALNTNEAIPQLACVAFELLSQGKQTATESEMLRLLERARDEVQQIKRYARDTPDEFLSRVELRSSLVVEGGRQQEGGKVVPFFQFRHLTFQEYLAAVAAVQAHYFGYRKSHNLLDPLRDRIASEEWKEVVPMAAVLARKQADPLITALIEEGEGYVQAIKDGRTFQGEREWRGEGKAPVAIGSLVTAMAEEAEVSPELIERAAKLMLTFARGCRHGSNWRALARSTYGADLTRHGMELFELPEWPDPWLGNSVATLLRLSWAKEGWEDADALSTILELTNSTSTAKIAEGMLLAVGLHIAKADGSPTLPVEVFERAIALIHHDARQVWSSACWVVALESRPGTKPSSAVLDRLMNLTLLEEECSDAARLAGFALYRLSNQVPPDAWRPSLSEEQRQTAQRLAGRSHPESDWADENMDYEDQVKAVLSILARDAAAERRQHFVEAFWQVTHDPREMNSFLDALGFPVSSLPNEIQVELAGAEDSDDLPP